MAPNKEVPGNDPVEKMYSKHNPKGSESDLEKAINILGVSPSAEGYAKDDIAQIVERLLRLRNASPRLSEELVRLEMIEKLASGLTKKVNSLSMFPMLTLQKNLPSTRFSSTALAPRDWCIVEDLSALEIAAKDARQELISIFGKDKGGKNVTVDTLSMGNPSSHFIERLIELFAKVNGADKVASTTEKNDGGCYRFIDAVHRYATGEAVGRKKEYKRLVRQWKVRREAASEIGA